MQLRKADLEDVPAIAALIKGYSDRGLLLARSEESIRAGVSDFTVAEEGGAIVGCGALMSLGGPGLGEVRSLAVREDRTGKGIGQKIVLELVAQAPRRGFADLLALTKRVGFFERLGFTVTRRELFLDKIMVDCHVCPLNLCCNETALTRPVPLAEGSLVSAMSEGEAK